MKTDYQNPFIRLQEYYLLIDIVNDDYEYDNNSCEDRQRATIAEDEAMKETGISMLEINQKTDISLEIIRKDLFTIFSWQQSLINSHPDYNSYHFITINEDCKAFENLNTNDYLITIIDNLSNNEYLSQFKQLMMSGLFDNILINKEKEYIDKMILPLTTDEAVALSSFKNKESSLTDSFNIINKRFIHTFLIKDSYLYNHHYDNLNILLETIDVAINNNKCLFLRYKTKDSIISYYFKPLKITYDATENLYYVLSIYANSVVSHRLDRIISLKECNNTIENQDLSLLDIAPYVWGNCFSDNPERVKIRFYNEANVWNKVKKDLAYRTNKKLYEQDGYLYYEDIVYGINKFKSWIFSYGSSAIVIEPSSLRTDIINSLKSRLSNQ